MPTSTTPRKPKRPARGIRITAKGRAILKAMDRGEYTPKKTAEASTKRRDPVEGDIYEKGTRHRRVLGVLGGGRRV